MKANATLRSRKQRGRKTARVTKKMMGGGEPIQIYIADKEGNVDNSVPAVTLTFDDKLLSSFSKEKKKDLVLKINVDKYTGSVRGLLRDLFNIIYYHNIPQYLLGLADGIARRKTIERANLYAKNKCSDECPDAVKEISEKSQKILSPTTCQLDIELSEYNGYIYFEVKKYHRIKFNTINAAKRTLFYPTLDFASSQPIGGLDYIDYNNDNDGIEYILRTGVTTNRYVLTTRDKTTTIENLITDLKNKTSIMVDEDGNSTTPEREKRWAEIRRQEEEEEKIKKEKEEKRREEYRRIEEKIQQEKIAEEKRRANLTPAQKKAEDDEAAKDAAFLEHNGYDLSWIRDIKKSKQTNNDS